MNLKEITENIRKDALSLGFCACGFTKVELLSSDKKALEKSISKGYTAGMEYLKKNIDKRSNPTLYFEKAKTVISVLISYYPIPVEIPSSYVVSAYARGNDYHDIIKKLLILFLEKIKQYFPEVAAVTTCDSSPVFERAWARKAGLGWIGKNNLLINPKVGSYVFLGELIIDEELEYDSEINEKCGNCTFCIDSCPTSALVSPYVLDASRCITYYNAENRNEEMPDSIVKKTGNRLYACDVCQQVCPYNQKDNSALNFFFHPNKYVSWTNEQWENISEETFLQHFKQTSIMRLKYNGLMRNIKMMKYNKQN
jgi:epoxyqueuosine reductase